MTDSTTSDEPTPLEQLSDWITKTHHNVMLTALVSGVRLTTAENMVGRYYTTSPKFEKLANVVSGDETRSAAVDAVLKALELIAEKLQPVGTVAVESVDAESVAA